MSSFDSNGARGFGSPQNQAGSGRSYECVHGMAHALARLGRLPIKALIHLHAARIDFTRGCQ